MSFMNKRWMLGLMLISLGLGGPLGCGDEEDSGPGELRLGELPAAEPMVYRTANLGVGLHHGATVQLKPGASANGVLERMRPVVDHAFLHVASYDLFAATFGEYLYYSADSSAQARNAGFFQSNRAAARFQPRAGDLLTEVKGAMAALGQDFASYSVVLDFWNPTAAWYVPWDGNTNRPPTNFGFYRDDLRQDLLAQITAVAQAHQPRYFIVGTDMERLLLPGASTFSQAEFANYVNFFQQAVKAIHEVSPQTKVGAGINWERFAQQVAPAWVASTDPAAAGDAPPGAIRHEDLHAAFSTILLPLVTSGDILALKSYVKPTDAQPSTYQFLRRLPDLYQTDAPLVWYSIGSPVSASAGYTQQRLYLEQFAAWNAGLSPEVVAWGALMNIDGADVGTGEIASVCKGMTGSANGFNVALERCFDGLFSSDLQPKPVFQALRTAAK